MVKEKLRELFKEYELSNDDYFKSPQGWTIITRSGIDKIQAKAEVKIHYESIVVEKDFVVIKAKAEYGKNYIETYGEADRNSNCRQTYPVAMAEKRAMSRAVLKLTGFYSAGVFSEDESDDFKRPKKKVMADHHQISRIESLVQGSNLDHDEREGIYNSMNDFSKDEAVDKIEYLMQNQLDPIQAGHNYTQTDISNNLK
jgi:hypothetical protein